MNAQPNTETNPHLVRHYRGKDRPSFSVEMLKTFLDTAETMGRDKFVMFLLAFIHGLRISEIAELRLSDLDIENGKILIRRLKGSVTSRQRLQHPNGWNEAVQLKLWLKQRAHLPGAEQTDILFPSRKRNSASCGDRRFTRQALSRFYVEVCQKAGIPEEYQHPHTIRHTCGQLLYDAGAPLEYIQWVLGHRSIVSTQIYAQPSGDRVSRDVEKRFDIIFTPGFEFNAERENLIPRTRRGAH